MTIPGETLSIQFWRWSRRRALVLAGIAVAFWLLGLVWFAETIVSMPLRADGPKADAIIVLTGGKGRLHEGFTLLMEGKAKQLLVSGVNEKLDVKKVAALEEQVSQIPKDLLACCVTLGYRADSTIGNAAEAADWLRQKGFHSFYLVTAHYHMRRALLDFRMAMPEATIYPVTVAPDTVMLDDWWEWPGTASLFVNEYNKYLLARARYEWITYVVPLFSGAA